MLIDHVVIGLQRVTHGVSSFLLFLALNDHYQHDPQHHKQEGVQLYIFPDMFLWHREKLPLKDFACLLYSVLSIGCGALAVVQSTSLKEVTQHLWKHDIPATTLRNLFRYVLTKTMTMTILNMAKT